MLDEQGTSVPPPNIEINKECITGVVDEDVEPGLVLEDFSGAVSDRLQAGQVQVVQNWGVSGFRAGILCNRKWNSQE